MGMGDTSSSPQARGSVYKVDKAIISQYLPAPSVTSGFTQALCGPPLAVTKMTYRLRNPLTLMLS